MSSSFWASWQRQLSRTCPEFVGSGNVAKANAELSSVRTSISAYQSENGGALPTSGGGSGAVTLTLITPYIQGGLTGTAYGVDGVGNVTSSTYAGMSFDGTKFNKT